MTGLPIVETKANDISAYIPTNVISITDGQIFLQSDLFNANQRPAVDVGLSVSRVGGAAQTKAMKKISGTLKIDLAQYRDMQAFAMFASDLDATSRRQLDRGARLTELLRQGQASPVPMAEQTVALWSGINGHLDIVPVADVLRFVDEFIEHLRGQTDVLAAIEGSGELSDESADELTRRIEAFTDLFRTADGQPLRREETDEGAAKGIGQARIVATKRS